MSDLEPRLAHNREAYRLFTKRKRQIAVVSVLLIIPIVILVPGALIPRVMVVLYAAGFGGMALYEVRRTRVFRRDLKEQKMSPEEPGGTR